MIQTRWYQDAAPEAVYEAWRSRTSRNPLVEIGTAGGKSVIIAKMCRQMLEWYPRTRIIMATHVKELVRQNYERLMQVWPDAPAGIYAAGLKRRDIKDNILFVSIQSFFKRAYDVQACDVLIIDEAHLVPHTGDGQYRTFINDCLIINPAMKVVGFTASPFRLSSGMLTDPYKGQEPLFDSIVFSMPYAKLLDEGYVTRLSTKGATNKIDLSSVHRRGGEFIAGELAAAADQDDINAAVADEIVEKGRDRAAWLIFCTSVKHAFHLRDLIRARGVTCETVTGDKKTTPDSLRDQYISDFTAGRIQCLTNVDVLSTGTDMPIVDMIGLVTATESIPISIVPAQSEGT